MAKRVTIADIAKAVGVSKTTVSHALSGKRPISEKVKQKVEEAASSLGYTPSVIAKAVNGQRMMLIAALVDSLHKPTTGTILQAFSTSLAKHGYNLSIFLCNEENAPDSMRYLSCGIVDGILNFIPEISVNMAASCCAPIPVMTYLRPHVDSPVYLDFDAGMNSALDYLWGLGHRKIGFIGGNKTKSADMNQDPQVEAFNVYMNNKGVSDPAMVKMTPGEFIDGIANAGELYNKGATAIMGANDSVASGIISWASREGVSVPQDLSVMGFNDSAIALQVSPTLTSVQFPVVETAEFTTEALVAKLNGATFIQHRVVVPKLIIRNSCAAVKPH